MPTHSLARLLASRIRTINWHVKNDTKGARSEPYRRNIEEVEELCKGFMPSGSGFDSGTRFWFDGSKPNRLIFVTSFHHMNDVGMYDGWTEHRVTVLAEFDGMEIVVGGRDRNGIKDHIAETFQQALQEQITEVWSKEAKAFHFVSSHGLKAGAAI